MSSSISLSPAIYRYPAGGPVARCRAAAPCALLHHYGLPIDEWTARFREQGFPTDSWSLHSVRVEVPDPPASASWLADIFELDVVRIAQDVAEVRLPGCAITFVCGSADRITAVVLTGRGAPEGPVAGLHYLVP